MRGLLISFFLFLLLFSLLLTWGKIAVDTCLPERGSRLFEPFEKIPPHVCEQLRQLDVEARRNAASGSQERTAKKFFSRDLQNFTLAVVRPTMTLSEFPHSPQAQSHVLLFLVIASLAVSAVTVSILRFTNPARAYDAPEEESPAAIRKKALASFQQLRPKEKK